MASSGVRCGAVSGLVAFILFALQLRVASGVQTQRRNQSVIPFTVWVTGTWASDAPEIQQVGQNMRTKTANLGQRMAEMRFAKWVPIGSKIRYFTDTDMVESARKISQMLRDEGVTPDAFAAFSNLRPAAYRADLWRYMVLWAHGGVYLDANIRLKTPIQTWVDFTSEKLVLVNDKYAKGCAYWNAMMASPPKNKYLKTLIGFVVNNIENHAYGRSALDITGPTAMCNAFRSMGKTKWFAFQKKFSTCQMVKVGLNAHVIMHTRREIILIAEKDEGLHYNDSVNHYGKMWHERTVFFDQLNTSYNVTEALRGAEADANVTEALQGAEADANVTEAPQGAEADANVTEALQRAEADGGTSPKA